MTPSGPPPPFAFLAEAASSAEACFRAALGVTDKVATSDRGVTGGGAGAAGEAAVAVAAAGALTAALGGMGVIGGVIGGVNGGFNGGVNGGEAAQWAAASVPRCARGRARREG